MEGQAPLILPSISHFELDFPGKKRRNTPWKCWRSAKPQGNALLSIDFRRCILLQCLRVISCSNKLDFHRARRGYTNQLPFRPLRHGSPIHEIPKAPRGTRKKTAWGWATAGRNAIFRFACVDHGHTTRALDLFLDPEEAQEEENIEAVELSVVSSCIFDAFE